MVFAFSQSTKNKKKSLSNNEIFLFPTIGQYDDELTKIRMLSDCSENDITGHLHNTFAVEQHTFGELREHELRPGGGNEEVTEANKKEYVR